MSEIYETHPKYEELIEFSKAASINEFFYAAEKPEFCDLLGTNKGIGVIRGKDLDKYLMAIEFEKLP